MIKTEIEVIDPPRAKALLDRMRINRAVRPGRVADYAHDLTDGRWLLTGETIKVDEDGELIDGQHRLQAVLESGVPMETIVVYGVNPDSQIAMDSGAMRSLADHLKFMGEINYRTLAAAIVVRYNRINGQPTKHEAPTHQRALDILESAPGLRDSVSATLPVNRAVKLPAGFAAALHYEMTDIDVGDTMIFWDKLIRGVDLTETCPVGHLRNRLLANAMARTAKLDRVMTWALTIKAWNLFREGQPVKQLRWRRGGSDPEAFPTLH